MSEISSGLVASIYLAFSDDGENIRFWTSNAFHAVEWAQENWETEAFVRLSDAEAIISDLQTLVIAENQRKQQLEAEVMWLKAAQPNIVLIADKDAVISQQSKRIEELTDGLEESDAIRDRCAHLLAETAVALKGPEKALHRHGWQDLPEVAAKQSAALKLAREALGEVQDLISESHGVYGLHLNGDESPWSEIEQGGRFERLTTLPEALAAIDALKGE